MSVKSTLVAKWRVTGAADAATEPNKSFGIRGPTARREAVSMRWLPESAQQNWCFFR